MRELESHVGRHQAKPIDAEAEKRRGWREHGILVVAEQDPRLSWDERELVGRLGTKLYGRRNEEPNRRVGGYASAWPEIVRDYWEAFGWHSAQARPIPPSPKAIDQMDETLRWLCWLDRDEARLAWDRSTGKPWKIIAYDYGIDRTTAWRRWTYALITIAARLNAGDVATPLQHFGVQH